MRILAPELVIGLVLSLTKVKHTAGYQLFSPLNKKIAISRRNAFAGVGQLALITYASTTLDPNDNAFIANAKETTGQSVEADISLLNEGAEVLSTLLANWEKATVDCTYADVPRELLEAKNKEQLLEKASVFALFDKSTSVVSCKKTNRIVRDYIGATGKGPLVGADKRLLRRAVADRVDPDSLDDYYEAVEIFSQSISRATSSSYAAGTADFDSVNNFSKEDDFRDAEGSNLDQARKSIVDANESLKKAVSLLNTAS